MSRQTTFLEASGETKDQKITLKVGLKYTTINGIQFNNTILWDALVDALVSIPPNSGDIGLSRRRFEAVAALQTRTQQMQTRLASVAGPWTRGPALHIKVEGDPA